MASAFELALGTKEGLIVAATQGELRAALDSPAEVVIIDLPASQRMEACERVRTLHADLVLVCVDSQAETEDWPPDLARRFLIRPLRAGEIVAALGVRPKILLEPAAARRRRLAQARLTPMVPPPAPLDDDVPRALEPVRRLSVDESLWEEPGEPAADASDEPPKRKPSSARPDTALLLPRPARPALGSSPTTTDRRRPLRVAAMVLLLVATAVGGIAIGRATASSDQAAFDLTLPASDPALPPPSTAVPRVVSSETTPAACDAALADADAAIGYLVGNIRDRRLSQSMRRYQANRRACRETSR